MSDIEPALKRVLHDQPHPDANSKPLELVLAANAAE
jgi:hypothetical protein